MTTNKSSKGFTMADVERAAREFFDEQPGTASGSFSVLGHKFKLEADGARPSPTADGYREFFGTLADAVPVSTPRENVTGHKLAGATWRKGMNGAQLDKLLTLAERMAGKLDSAPTVPAGRAPSESQPTAPSKGTGKHAKRRAAKLEKRAARKSASEERAAAPAPAPSTNGTN